MANTGKKLVLALKKIQNPGSVETGETKDNLSSDPDYIAPYIDLEDCPVIYTTACPVVKYTRSTDQTVLEYEFSLANAVVENPLIVKITVELDSGGFLDTFVLPNTPSPNYFSGSFAGLSVGTPYLITVKYWDVSDNVITTCNIS